MASLKDCITFLFCVTFLIQLASTRSHDEKSQLESALRRGDVELARVLIGGGALEDFSGPKNREKIYSKLRAVESLLSNGIAGINTLDNNLDKVPSNKGAFDVVLIPGSSLVTRLIVNVTAVKSWSNKTTKDGRKPIHMISSLPDISSSIIQIILENGNEDINSRTDSGITPLMFAATSGNLELVKFLAEKGARINDVATLSLNGEETMEGHFAYEKLFSKKRLKFNKWDFHFSALVSAIISNNLDIVTYLLSKGADVNNKGQGWLVLFGPVINGQTEVVEILLKSGIDVNSKDMLGSTSLHKAAKAGHTGMAEILLKNGAFVNATDAFGWKPLHVASFFSKSGGEELICLLVQSGSSIEDITDGGYSPLNLVIAGRHPEFLSFLVKNFDSLHKTKINLPQVDLDEINTGIVESVIRLGAPLNGQDDVLGWSPLHWAAATGDYDVAKMLVNDYGAVVNVRSKMDLNPFETAAFFGRKKVAKFLKTAKDLVK